MSAPGSRERLSALGIVLPPPPKPTGLYSPTTRHGGLLFVSGHAALSDDGFVRGVLGSTLGLRSGQAAARLATLGCLASIDASLGGLVRVDRVLKVLGFVACTPSFEDHPAVLDGCTSLLADVFGPCQPPARSAVGMASLPYGTAVEVEMIVAVRE